MASTAFVDGVTLIVSAWLNDVDAVTYDLFGNGTSYTGNGVLPGTLSVAGLTTLTGNATFAGAAGQGIAASADANSVMYLAATPNASSASAWIAVAGSGHANAGQVQYNAGGAAHVFKVSNVIVGSIGSTGIATFEQAVIASNSVAPPAGGANTMGFKFSSTANFGVFGGSGAPTLSAGKGSIYLRTDGSGTSTRLYTNTDGGTTWTNITAAA
jgi:hypothetical protein